MTLTQFNIVQSYKIVSTYGFICKSLGFSCNHLESLHKEFYSIFHVFLIKMELSDTTATCVLSEMRD